MSPLNILFYVIEFCTLYGGGKGGGVKTPAVVPVETTKPYKDAVDLAKNQSLINANQQKNRANSVLSDDSGLSNTLGG